MVARGRVRTGRHRGPTERAGKRALTAAQRGRTRALLRGEQQEPLVSTSRACRSQWVHVLIFSLAHRAWIRLEKLRYLGENTGDRLTRMLLQHTR